jgi:glycosyltransferase involved in cell wall biosynthesis
MTDGLCIAIVTNYPADAGRITGGVQAVSARLVDELACFPELELHVVHCHSDIDASRTVQQGRVTIHFLAQTRRRVIPNMTSGIARIVRLLHDLAPDVVHAHGPSFAVAALRAGYQPMWTIHGVLRQEAHLFPGLFNRLSFLLAQYYEWQAFRRVHLITTVSPYVVEAYRGRTRARWEVIENAADRTAFTLPRQPVRGRLLMPGSLIPRKDPVTLIQAVAEVRRKVPYVQVHLAGTLADTVYVGEVRREIARLGLEDVVTLLGSLDAGRLREEYTAAEVVVLSSRQESAPLAVVEAMAAGLPVVATAVGGVPYLVEDGVTGYRVPPGDPGTLARALIGVLEQPGRAQAMGLAARAAARDRFDPEHIAMSYLELYREAARSLQGSKLRASGRDAAHA